MKAKVYTSISELPIYNWRMINETDDLRFLLAVRNPTSKTLTGEVLNELSETWQKVFDEFIDTFGISDNYRDMIELRIQLMQLKIEQAVDGIDNRTFIEICEWKIKRLAEKMNDGSASFESVQAYVEKYLRFPINETRCSVSKYYNYLKMMNEDGKRD